MPHCYGQHSETQPNQGMTLDANLREPNRDAPDRVHLRVGAMCENCESTLRSL